MMDDEEEYPAYSALLTKLASENLLKLRVSTTCDASSSAASDYFEIFPGPDLPKAEYEDALKTADLWKWEITLHISAFAVPENLRILGKTITCEIHCNGGDGTFGTPKLRRRKKR